MADKINEYKTGVKLEGYGSRGMLNVIHPHTALFMQEMVQAGVLYGKAFFYNFDHIEHNVDQQVYPLIEEVMYRIEQHAVSLKGRSPEETFKR